MRWPPPTQSLDLSLWIYGPVFGFVGLTAVQQQCQQFEQICGTVSSPEKLAGDFETLKNKIFESKLLIEEEKKRLEIYNSNCS